MTHVEVNCKVVMTVLMSLLVSRPDDLAQKCCKTAELTSIEYRDKLR
jgi:hypothetical protein